jgi:hypothetical protein
MSDLITFRDSIRKLSPPWLQNGLAEKILYTIGVQIDAFGDALVAGLNLRFPGRYSDESLPLLGRERRIRRGRVETTAVYATRLRRWLIDHRQRGSPRALLAQLYAHFAPANFQIQLIYYSGRRYTMDTAGNVVQDDIVWSPDLVTTQWARWWLFYYTDAFPSPTADDITNLIMVPQEWNAGHCLGTLVLVPTGSELWDFPLGRQWNRSRAWDSSAITTIPIG